MPVVLHWRITTAMTALYILVSIAIILLVQDQTARLTLLFIAFALALLMGNLLVRSRARRGGG